MMDILISKLGRHQHIIRKDGKTECGRILPKNAILTQVPLSIPYEGKGLCLACVNVLAKRHYRNLELAARKNEGEPYLLFYEGGILGNYLLETLKAKTQIQAEHEAHKFLKHRRGYLLPGRAGKFL